VTCGWVASLLVFSSDSTVLQQISRNRIKRSLDATCVYDLEDEFDGISPLKTAQ
jgi:hypothetical protein